MSKRKLGAAVTLASGDANPDDKSRAAAALARRLARQKGDEWRRRRAKDAAIARWSKPRPPA